jgi:hypothetical protein
MARNSPGIGLPDSDLDPRPPRTPHLWIHFSLFTLKQNLYPLMQFHQYTGERKTDGVT